MWHTRNYREASSGKLEYGTEQRCPRENCVSLCAARFSVLLCADPRLLSCMELLLDRASLSSADSH